MKSNISLRHIGIVTKELDESVKFYSELLGFKEFKRMDEGGKYIDKLLNIENSSVITIKLKNDHDQIIELLHYNNPVSVVSDKNITDIGLTHFALTVDDLDMIYDRFVSAGILFSSSPSISPDGYAKVAFCKDPNGVFIELVEVL